MLTSNSTSCVYLMCNIHIINCLKIIILVGTQVLLEKYILKKKSIIKIILYDNNIIYIILYNFHMNS